MDKIYGRNPVSELIKSGSEIDKIYVNKELIDGSLKSILGMIPGLGSKLKDIEIDDKQFKQIAMIAQGEFLKLLFAYVDIFP